MYKEINESTDGIIVFEEYNSFTGEYSARARHPVIADVIWHRCFMEIDRSDVLLRIIKEVNLTYSLDALAFDSFIRNESVVDSIKSLELKIQYFDEGCKKDPSIHTIRQHYARMLQNAGSSSLALSQIDEALKMDKTRRVFHNTKGNILSDLAKNSENIEIGRRYLVQAEQEFRVGIHQKAADDYGWSGLANLFIDWAIRCANQVEYFDYLRRAEEVVSEGIVKCRNKEALFVASSKIQQELGNKENSKEILKKSIASNSSAVISRYLLAKLYRKNGEYPEALTCLEPVIKTNYSAYRCFIEYARNLLLSGESYKMARTYLELCHLIGSDDPEFLSIYGGCLYLDGEFVEASDVFYKSTEKGFSADEITRIYFDALDPQDRQKKMELHGKVTKVKAGYCFIDSTDYKKILCPFSKNRGLNLYEGQRVQFEIAFNARGPVAINVKTI